MENAQAYESDSDDEKTIHEPKGGEFEGSSHFDSLFASSSEDNMLTLSENEDGNDGTGTQEHKLTHRKSVLL